MSSSEKEGSPCEKNMNSGSIEPKAETKNRIPAITSVRLRPRLVARNPDRAEPMIHPINALAEVNPCQPSV